MSGKNEPLVVERTFDAPAALVWKALTDNDAIKHWSFEMKEFRPEVGFAFQFTAGKDNVQYDHRCQITEVVPGKKLAYSWRYEGYEGNSLVTFELFAEGRKTRLRLTHVGLETFPKIPAFVRSNFQQGWTQIIGTNLKNFVESTTNIQR